jgi:ethanolamine utilization protein EutA (predicted chaperonin)
MAILISVGAQLTTTHITPETLGWGIVLSIGVSACRAAIKAVIEAFSGVKGDSQV